MKFSEIVDQASEFLRRRERVSYRALKREFDLDDESLEDLKAELIDAQRVAADEDGKVLVWIGQGSPESRACYVLWVRRVTKRLSNRIANARKCSPAKVSGRRS